MAKKKYILKVNCLDQTGIVARVTTLLYDSNCLIISLDQYSDPDTKRFFMRLELETDLEQHSLEEQLTPVFEQFEGKCQIFESGKKTKLLILCSKPDHCLLDILSKAKRGSLQVEIVGVVSNHETLRSLVEWYGIPFHHLPVTKETKPQQEAKIAELFSHYGAEMIILARYMQILSNEFCTNFSGQVINIHHSFLPSFKGAAPYRQAHERGVKVIGATGHFVTADLDEGPIIIQQTIRVKHSNTVAEYTGYGADIECLVLSRAIKYVTEFRVFINEHKTVVLK